MKVFVAVLLVIGSVAARGSGPYLPSGWRPDGPAFYLPSEVSKPVAKAEPIVVEENEASGSDALREYGPPKLEVLIDVNQGLPDVATEQTFLRAIKEEIVEAAEEANVEEKLEQVVANVEESATESQTTEAIKAVEQEAAIINEVESTGSPASDAVEQKEESSNVVQANEEQQEEYVPVVVIPEEIVVPTAAIEEVVVPLFQQALEQDAVPTVSEVVASEQGVEEALPTQAADSAAAVTVVENEVSQEVAPTPAEEVVEKVAEGVSNIAEAIINLEKEVKAIEVQSEVNADIKSSQEASGALEQAPEGFLEYGPPGFLEYGPPKDQALAGLAAEIASSAAVENNEVRRRRFSPKFRSTKKH